MLGRRFIDLDAEIERRSGRTIAELFTQSGELQFRNIESSALSDVMREPEALVLALGGGTWVQPNNERLIRGADSAVVYLDAPAEELWRRVNKDGAGLRPLVHDEPSFRKLYEERRPHYLRAQHRVGTAGKSLSEVAEEILEVLRMEEP